STLAPPGTHPGTDPLPSQRHAWRAICACGSPSSRRRRAASQSAGQPIPKGAESSLRLDTVGRLADPAPAIRLAVQELRRAVARAGTATPVGGAALLADARRRAATRAAVDGAAAAVRHGAAVAGAGDAGRDRRAASATGSAHV